MILTNQSAFESLLSILLIVSVSSMAAGFLTIAAYLCWRNWCLEHRDSKILDAVWLQTMPQVPLVDQYLQVIGKREERQQDAKKNSEAESAELPPFL